MIRFGGSSGTRMVSKCWCFTVNGEEEAINVYYTSLEKPDSVRYLIVGRERGSDTGRLHLQGYFTCDSAVRVSGIKKWGGFWSTCHLEKRRGSHEEARDYCKKDGDFKELGTENLGAGKRSDLLAVKQSIKEGATFSELCDVHFDECAKYGRFFKELIIQREQEKHLTVLQERLRSSVLKPWQQELADVVSNSPDPRKVNWLWSVQGNVGKSYMADYLAAFHDAMILTPGKKQDLTYIWTQSPKPICIFDLSRTVAPDPELRHGPLDVIYSLMEDLKNGRMTSTKYESKSVFFAVPHVIVFANFEPDRSKMSEDRWVVKQVY